MSYSTWKIWKKSTLGRMGANYQKCHAMHVWPFEVKLKIRDPIIMAIAILEGNLAYFIASKNVNSTYIIITC